VLSNPATQKLSAVYEVIVTDAYRIIREPAHCRHEGFISTDIRTPAQQITGIHRQHPIV
jgi:hypothetical protein